MTQLAAHLCDRVIPIVPTRQYVLSLPPQLRRAFELDVLACPRCRGRLRLIACITQPTIIGKILSHVGLPADAPEPQPARAPPWAAPSDRTASA